MQQRVEEMDGQRAPTAGSHFTTEDAGMTDVPPKTQVSPGVTQRKHPLHPLMDIAICQYVHPVFFSSTYLHIPLFWKS